MTNKFLLNLLGFNPDVTNRKSRHAIESIVSRLCLASLICLCMLTVGVGNVWGATTTLAGWTFTSSSYPSNKTNFTATTGTMTTSSTFYLNGTGSTWNATKGYAFTAVTDITITLTLTQAVPAGTVFTLSAATFYNKASNAPMTGFSIKAKEGSGSFGTTGVGTTSWSLSTSSATKTTTYTTQAALASGTAIAFQLTGTGKAGAGQGYMNNITITATTYSVTYNGNSNTGGSVPTDNVKYITGTTVTVKANSGSLVRTNYTFDGWNTNTSGTGTNYAAGSGTFAITADKTLYAKWTSAGTSVSLSKAATTNGSFKLSSSNTGTPEINSVSTAGGSGTVYVVGTPSSGYYVSNVTQSGASAAPTITEVSENNWTVVYGSGTTGTSTITVTFSPIWALKGDFDSWGDGYVMTGTGTVSVTRTLTANTRYEFKIYNKATAYGNNGAIVHSISDWTFETDKNNCVLYTGPAGDYTFSINTSTKATSVTYPSVTHPNANYVYIKKGAGWSDARIYNYQSGSDSKMSDWKGSPILASCEICDETYYYGAAYFNKIIFRDGGSNQSNEVSLDRGKWLDETTHADSWSTFDKYTISYDKGTGSGATMASETDICPGGEQALSANTYTKDHYHFTGWIADRDVTINSATVTQGTLIADEATIENIQSNITLTAQWAINQWTLTWNWGGGSTSSTSYTLYPATSGLVNYNAAITKPANGTMSKTGYNFSSWSSNATTMPDEALTITANWSAKTYSNTLDREGGTTGSESVTTTYNSSTLTSYTAPTKTGYTFGGYWSADNGTGTEVIGTNGALKTSVTIDAVAWTDGSGNWVKDGAVTLYAKWTAKNYTVTLNDGSGSGGDGTVSVTYNSNTNISDVTKPTYTGYDFRGYYTAASGEGTKVINGNGEWITGTSYVDAGGNWVYDGSPTLYAYWTAYTYENYRTMCAPVTCGAPDLSSPTPTAYGATISWTDAGKAGTLDHYEYAVWADGAVEPTSGFTSTGTTKSATVSGLLSNTLYNYKVRRVCSGDDESFWSDGTFTTSYVALTFSVPTGASAVAGQNSNIALPDAEVPTSCGDCWDFVGWTTAAYAESSSAPSKLFYEGDIVHLSSSDGTTLHAVYQKSKYQRISSTGDLTAGEDYVLMNIMQGNEYALANSAQADFPTTDAAWADIRMLMETDGDDSYVKNPGASIIWRFSGTYSSGQLYNAAADKYLNLSGSGSILNTTNNLTFGISASNSLGWDVYSTNYLRQYKVKDSDPIRGGWDAVAALSSGNFSAYIYKRTETKYATSPSCEVYTVTWNVNNGATTSTTDVLSCSGHLGSLPSAPADNTLVSCITTGGKFMGWSASRVLPATDTRPDDLFSNVVDAPDITDDVTFYAVFAKETTGATGATSKEYTFTSGSWADSEGAWTSGKDGGWYNSAVQVSTAKSGANATTKSSYDDVTKVAVSYFTNGSAGAGTITIEVGGTAYTGSASVTSSGGTTPRTINFTPPSSALDGAVKITVTCSTNSIYIKSVTIYYTGTTTTYEGYRTACCNDPGFSFTDENDAPVTEYTIIREDLASASAAVEIGCNYTSANTEGAITWYSTRRAALGFPATGAYTWTTPSSQPAGLNIDIANKKISASATGVWTITINQADGGTTYCPVDAVVTVRVKTVDKFVDAVNGNFGGDAQRREDTGDGITLPTEAEFSIDDGCSTERRLIGWVKESDLSGYTSGYIDSWKTGDPATNKVIAPGTKVQATGITWYAVWGEEK